MNFTGIVDAEEASFALGSGAWNPKNWSPATVYVAVRAVVLPATSEAVKVSVWAPRIE